ncbi:MAG TPA: MFS transporter [Acidimicrobiales bacterium]|nr:MFS transporter [Acidimicrobiales bacterium]
MDVPASGSSVAESIGNAFRLTSDRERHGQDAFTASPFSRLLITHVLSLGGDALVTLALAGSIFFSTSLHAARGRVALTLLITIAPFAIVAPLLGPIIDRAGSRRLMVVLTAAGRGVACLLMARYINSFGLYPAALLSLVCSKGYTVTKATLVPAAVETPRDLVEANSKLAVSGAIAGFLIALPGIVILKLANGAWVLRADVIVFAACAASALRLQTVRPDATAADTSELVGQEAAEVAAHEVRAQPLPAGAIQVAAFTMGVLRFLVGFLTFLLAFGLRSSHAPAWWYGVVLSCSIGGNLIGAAAAPWLRSRVREELILAGSAATVAGAGILALFFNSLNDWPAASLLAGVLGIAAGGSKLAFDAMVQRHIPAANQGRAFGRFEAGFQLVWVLGGLVPVIIPLSLSAGILVATVAAVVAAAVFLVGTRMARLGQLPSWWPGVRPPRPRRKAAKAAAAAAAPVGASGHDPTQAFGAGSWPPRTAPGREPTVPLGDSGWSGTTRSGPSQAGSGREPTVPLGDPGWSGTTRPGATRPGPTRPGPNEPDDERPWEDRPPGWRPGGRPGQAAPEVPGTVPDLGIYPPPIAGPPPLGQQGRPVPPPLEGPPPVASPLASPLNRRPRPGYPVPPATPSEE